MSASPPLIREAVGIFDNAEVMDTAIKKLESSGFDRALISLLASHKSVDEKLDHKYHRIEDSGDNTQMPRTVYVSRNSLGDAEGALIGTLVYVGAVGAAGVVVASGGAIAAAIAAATLTGAGGGLIGSVMANMLGRYHANFLEEQIQNGGLLLWVRTWTQKEEERATRILTDCGAQHVHVHEIPADIPQYA